MPNIKSIKYLPSACSQCYWNKESLCVFPSSERCVHLIPLDEAIKLYEQITGDYLTLNEEERHQFVKVRETLATETLMLLCDKENEGLNAKH